MTSSSQKSAVKVNLLGKRNLEDDLGKKTILKKHKENSEDKETTKEVADNLQQIELLETKFEQGATKILRTLCVANLSPHTEISHIIDFFKDVGEVVHVRIVVNNKGKHTGYSYVQFASSNQAKMALKKKNGESLHYHKIFLDVSRRKAEFLSRPEYCINHKVWYKDDYLGPEEDETVDGLDEAYFVEGATKILRTLYVANLSPHTEISHIIDFFKDVGEVVYVRIVVNDKGKHKGYSFVQFASSNQAKMALKKKNGESLHYHKILLDVPRRKAEFFSRPEYCINHKVWYKDDYLGPEEDETVDGGLDEYPCFVKEAAIRKKTLFVTNLSSGTIISDIIDFFKNVGKVVRVQLAAKMMYCGLVEFAFIDEAKKALEKNGEFLNDNKIYLAAAKTDQTPMYCLDHKVWYKDNLGRDETSSYFVKGKHVGCGFVEFASSYEAKKALKEKNGEYLLDHQISLQLAKSAPYPPGPKHNIARMLCYEDYLRRESLVIEDDETPNCVEAAAIRKKTIFVNHLSCHTGISHIIDFFKDVGEVVHVRLIVNHKGKHVGYGFVEFASANEAKKALEKKNGEYLHDCKILLDVAKTEPNLPPPKYCIDHKVWYEDYLRQENLLIEEDEAVEGLDVTPDYVKEVAIRKKTLVVAIFPGVTTICNIVNFFKDVGVVCHVRLIVDDRSKHVGCAFVEFASANEAKKALHIKNGEILCGRQVFVSVMKMAPYPIRPKYKLAEMLWCKDNLGEGEEEEEEEEEEEDEDLEIKRDVKKQTAFCGKKITFHGDD